MTDGRPEMIALDPAARIEKYGHVIQGSYLPRALGAFSYSHSAFSTEIELGRYCSFAAGVQVIPWTVDKPEDWDKLIAMGVDGIITNDPGALVAHLKAKGMR